MSGHDDRRLRAFFRDLHDEIDPPVPPYGPVARPGRGEARAEVAPSPVRPALARAFALALAAGVLLLLVRGWSRRAPADDDMMRLASRLSAFEAPTDFLLRTPGVEFFRSSPKLGAGMDAISGDRRDLIQEEVSQ